MNIFLDLNISSPRCDGTDAYSGTEEPMRCTFVQDAGVIAMPPREQADPGTDRRKVRAWVRDNPSADARLTEADDPDEPGGVIFIVNVPDHREMVRAREELVRLGISATRLRVRRWKPSRAEIDRVNTWVWNNNRPREWQGARVVATWIDVYSGLLSISLNKVDRTYAEELEAAAEGVAFVQPEPDTGVSIRRDA
ncbi:hypothetical protein [Kribbella sp. CA-294648]|uniref:hypothetical protein n=1 Tax=Kribbella sp. CA-294648 TaxID=3239948 RepID=UPI003D94E1DD